MLWVAQPALAGPAPKLGLALAAQLAAASPTGISVSASSVAAAALCTVPAIAYTARPGAFTAKADAASWDSDDAAEPGWQTLWEDGLHLLSVFHPKDLLMVFGRNMGFQLLLKFNIYMMQLLEHEKACIDAEQIGQQGPDPPPIPNWKPCLDRGLWLGMRELSVKVVKKVYEAIAVRRMGRDKADALLRDHKTWIRDVLAFKHRSDPPMTRYVKYQFAALHSTGLYFCADATVAILLQINVARKRKDWRTRDKVVLVVRGAAAQTLRAMLRLAIASAGAAAGSLLKPGIGTHIGFVAFDLGAMAMTGPLTDFITGDTAPAPAPHPDQPVMLH